MSDDFDDDLYNAYDTAETEDGFHQNDLYDKEPVEVNEEQEEEQQQKSHDDLREHPPQQQQQQMNNEGNMGMWGFQNIPYQQYMAAYQMSLQQQMMNPYQVQHMMRQYNMQSYNYNNKQRPTPSQPTHTNTSKRLDTEPQSDKPIVASAANTDEGKMFIGGLNWETTDESLRDYFSQFGQVIECTVMRDPLTQRSRGFGFLTMKENAEVDKIVSQDHHYLDGKRIDPKRAIPREEQDKTEKIFVGGISPEVNEEEFRQFFTQFGTVLDATLMLERDTGRPRGFGFITFESSEGVEEALRQTHLAIKDKTIEVKRAMPKGKQTRAPMNTNYRPNSRYQPNTMRYGMYPQMAAAAAAAAAYYGGNNNNNGGGNGYDGYGMRSQRGGNNHRYNQQDNARHSRDNEGGPVHASHSTRNQSHYRPY
ncbi:hypothetical protein A0J61_02367 [Choanephora cucurbitarum]|uniref:RRM domain-containing protein n=1 Tax=Choanephora cucurbitarum TaxID=101091 RepID=A0A1C7NKJ3_9FUNG|nr:hypothetical protein A0J61_02367 [Choanephora cucurbitarum]